MQLNLLGKGKVCEVRQMKRNIPMVIILLSLIFSFYMVNSINVNKGKINELQDIYEVVTNNDIMLHTWSAYSREELTVMNTTEVNELIEGIQENKKGFMCTEKIENDHHSKVVGTKNNSYVDERIAIATYENREKYTVNISYQVVAKELNSDIINEILPNITGSSTFYMIQGSMEDPNMSLQDLVQSLVRDFSGEVKEGIIEDDFISVSAYNLRWFFTIPLEQNDKMNLQIGVRSVAHTDIVDVTIGTPIITVEH
jgi:hypothetical protein